MRTVHTGWCVWLSDPTQPKDRCIASGLAEEEARAIARRLDEERYGPSGPQTPTPFPFHYAAHWNWFLPGTRKLNDDLDREAELVPT